MLSVYAEELLQAVLAEDRAARFYEAYTEGLGSSYGTNQLKRLLSEAQLHASDVVELLRAVDPEAGQDVTPLAKLADDEVTARVTCPSLDPSSDRDLLKAVMRIEMFLSTQYRKCRDTARYLGLARDRARLTAIYEAKSARVQALEALLESESFSRNR